MDATKAVGEKIKFLREGRDISVEMMAENTNLTVEQIMRIEDNIDLPSLAPLIKIAKVLDVRLGTFLDDNEEVGPVVCRKDGAAETISFSNNSVLSRRHMTYRSLAKSKRNRHMEPFMIDVAPTSEDYILSIHEGEEFIYVVQGKMEITYGEDTYFLDEGDSIYYDSSVPHHVHSYMGSSAKILAVIYTPI